MRLRTIIAAILCMITCLSAHALDGGRGAYVSDIMSEQSLNVFDAYMRNTHLYGDYDKGQWPEDIVIEYASMIDAAGFPHGSSAVKVSSHDKGTFDWASDLISARYQHIPSWSLFEVMQVEVGRWQAWDYKVHAYYTILMKEYGLQKDNWIESVLPEENALQEPEALSRAKELLESMYGCSESSREKFIAGTSYITKQNHEHVYEWAITFQSADKQYQFLLSQDGVLMGFSGADGSFFSSDLNLFNGMGIVSAADWPINANKATAISKAALFEKYHDADEHHDPSTMGVMVYPLHTSLYSVSPQDMWLIHFYQEGEVIYEALLEPDGNVRRLTHVTDEVDLVSPSNG